MRHLDDEQILAAVRAGNAPTGGATASHLAACARCRHRVIAAKALRDAAVDVEAEEAPDVDTAVPAFDALVLPALGRTAEPAPEPVPAPTASASWRLTAALALRQARLVPRALWPLTALGFAALLFIAWNSTPPMGPSLLGPGVSLLVTAGVLTVCEPRRDPRRELLYSMPVPPVAVWLTRLALVVGVDLLAATVLSVAVGGLAGVGVTGLVALWLGPALLTASLAAFGSVWRSPAVGAVLGGLGWLAGAAAAVGDLLPLPGAVLRVAAVMWSTNVGTLAAALLLVGAAAFLVTRPGHVLRAGAA